MENLLTELSRPFHPSEISFKPGATKGDRAIALAYADLRVYMNRLDEVCGLDWSIEYKPWGDERIIACLTINGVTRCSTGEMKDQDEKNEIGGTVAEAQSMKRACTMFGLGRYLYDLPTGWMDYDPSSKKFTDAAKTKLTGILTQHYRKATEGAQKPATPPTSEVKPPRYVIDFQQLTGKPYDFVGWVAKLHANSNGPCTVAQYGFLVGIIDVLTNNQHSYVLSLLCQSEITKNNMPGHKVADKLLELLTPTIKVEGDDTLQEIANPSYRPDLAAMISDLQQVAA